MTGDEETDEASVSEGAFVLRCELRRDESSLTVDGVCGHSRCWLSEVSLTVMLDVSEALLDSAAAFCCMDSTDGAV